MGRLSSFFQHPALLAVAAAVAIPIIIELLFRLHRRRVELPTIRWLLKHKDQKKIKRQNRLLIILRMLAIFLLVLAVARPRLDRTVLGGAVRKRLAVVVVDATTSMGQRAGTDTAFDLACRRARTLIRGLGAETQVAVAQVADGLRVVAEPTGDIDAAANAVRTLALRGGAAPISDGIEWARTVIDEAKKNDADLETEVYVFSDFQDHTWREGDATGSLLKAVSEAGDLFLVDVAPDRPFNVVMTRFEPVEPIASVGVPVEFRASLEGYQVVDQQPASAAQEPQTRAPAPSVRVTFLVNGRKKRTMDLPEGVPIEPRPGETSARWAWTTTFSHTFGRPGEYLLTVEAVGDQNQMDNSRAYLITVPVTHRVLIFDADAPGSGRTDARVEEDVAVRRARKSYWLQQAVEPDQPAGTEKVTHFTAVVRHPADAVRENFRSYAAVCLVGLPDLPDPLVPNCEAYVRDGGALLIFLDEDVNRLDYGRKLVKRGRGLMPVILGPPQAPIGSRESGARNPKSKIQNPKSETELALGDSTHPWLALFAQETTPVRARVSRYMSLTVDESAKDRVNVVATFSDGVPAIVEQRYGPANGRVCLFNFTADARWIDLPGLTQFLPLVQETLRGLVGNPDEAVNLDVGDRFRSPVLMTSQHVRLTTPDKEIARLTPTGGVDAHIGQIRESTPAGASAGEAEAEWTDVQVGTDAYKDVTVREVKRSGTLTDTATFLEAGVFGGQRAYRIVGPNPALLVPFVGKRVDVKFKPVSRGWQISYRPRRQGLYTINARLGVVPRSQFVANLPVVEGDPSRLTQDDARSTFAGVPFAWVAPTESTAELVARRHAVLEAALILLWLVAGVLAIESILAAVFGRRRGAVAVKGVKPLARQGV